MFLDASAIVAILAHESDVAILAERLSRADSVFVSAICLYEAVLGIARLRKLSLADARRNVDRFVEETQAGIVPIDADIGAIAIAAFEKFGKGRHPAGLNLGDCFAYACARQLDVPLLCEGDDFRRTDITLA